MNPSESQPVYARPVHTQVSARPHERPPLRLDAPAGHNLCFLRATRMAGPPWKRRRAGLAPPAGGAGGGSALLAPIRRDLVLGEEPAAELPQLLKGARLPIVGVYPAVSRVLGISWRGADMTCAGERPDGVPEVIVGESRALPLLKMAASLATARAHAPLRSRSASVLVALCSPTHQAGPASVGSLSHHFCGLTEQGRWTPAEHELELPLDARLTLQSLEVSHVTMCTTSAFHRHCHAAETSTVATRCFHRDHRSRVTTENMLAARPKR